MHACYLPNYLPTYLNTHKPTHVIQYVHTYIHTYIHTSFDLSSGYWQLEVAPEDRHKTAFIKKYGLFQHARMGFVMLQPHFNVKCKTFWMDWSGT